MTSMFRIDQTFVRALENDFVLSLRLAPARTAPPQRRTRRSTGMRGAGAAGLQRGAAHAAEDVFSTQTNGDNVTAFSSAGQQCDQFQPDQPSVPNAVGVDVNGATVATRTLAVPRGVLLSDHAPVSSPAPNAATGATGEPALPPARARRGGPASRQRSSGRCTSSPRPQPLGMHLGMHPAAATQRATRRPTWPSTFPQTAASG